MADLEFEHPKSSAPAKVFATTLWTAVVEAAGGDSDEARRALERI